MKHFHLKFVFCLLFITPSVPAFSQEVLPLDTAIERALLRLTNRIERGTAVLKPDEDRFFGYRTNTGKL